MMPSVANWKQRKRGKVRLRDMENTKIPVLCQPKMCQNKNRNLDVRMLQIKSRRTTKVMFFG
jgi:hypothetical protein